MRHILRILINNMKRNYFAIFFSLFCGVMLCILFSVLGKVAEDTTLEKIKVGYMDNDNSVLSEDFLRYLQQDLYYDIEEGSYEHLSSQLIEKKISVIIEVPEGFREDYIGGKKVPLTLTSLDDYENVAFIELYINNYMSTIDLLSQAAEGKEAAFDQYLKDKDEKNIGIKQTIAYETNQEIVSVRSSFINSVGFYLMFVFIDCIFIIFSVFDDRVSKVFHRIQVTPIEPVQYLIGNGIFGFLVCQIEIAIFCGYIYFSKVSIGVPLSMVILVMSLFSIFSVCFSLAVALFTKSKNSITSVIIGYSTIGNIVGGAYFSLETAPKQLQMIARSFPQFWYMDIFRKLQENVEAIVYPGIIVLTLFAILSLLAGAVIYQQNYKNS